MAYVTADGARLFFRHFGNGQQTVVLSHGSFSDHRDFQGNLDALASSYRVVAYDRRGCGESSGTQTPTDGQWADDLVRLLDYLALDSAVLCGVSFGAMLSLEVAIRFNSRVDALVLIGGSAREYLPAPGWEVYLPDRRADLDIIDVPSLVIHGRHDQVFDVEHARELAGGIRDARLVLLDGGHNINTEQPTAVSRAVRQFIEENGS